MPATASLIVPVYGGWSHVRTLLKGVACRNDNLEIVVVDDASNDGGASRLREQFANIHVHVRPVNGGFAAAVNSGLEMSSGEVLVVANSDLQLPADDLLTLINAAQSNPDRIVGPRTLRPTGAEAWVVRTFPTPLGDCLELFVPFLLLRSAWRRLRGINPRGCGLITCDWVNGACMAFHRSVWDRVGPLDESFGMYSEEVDWQKRAATLGIQAAYVPGATVVHDEMHGIGVASEAYDSRFLLLWRAKQRYHQKHSGHTAKTVMNLAWIAAYSISAPMWTAATLIPRWRDRARAERRRLRMLAVAALLRRPL